VKANPLSGQGGYSEWLCWHLSPLCAPNHTAWALPYSNTVPRTATTSRVQGLAYNMTEFLMPNNAWLAS
jgi:hypothetical protein